MIGKNLKLDKDIKNFSDELKKCFSKDEIEDIARETGFVKRKGKIEAWEFVCLCCFMDAEVASNTLVTLCTKLSAKIEVVNPENVVSDGNVVNAISASAPTV